MCILEMFKVETELPKPNLYYRFCVVPDVQYCIQGILVREYKKF
jgi:hypothetical protein